MQLQMPLPAQQIILLAQQEYLALLGLLIRSQGKNKISFRGGSWGRAGEVHIHSVPEMTRGFLMQLVPYMID